MNPVRGLFVLLFICFSFFFYDLSRTDLWSSHEARAAQNAQRMIDDDAWALPRLYDDQPELQKPPAYYWMAAGIASLRDGVVDRWAVRLPAALAGLGTVLLVWWFLTERGRPVAGLIAGVVLATSIHFTSASRTGRIDMPLTFCTTASVFLILSRLHPQVRIVLAGILFAMALLLKGPVGMVLPAVVMAVWLTIGAFRWTLSDGRAWYMLGGSCIFGLALALPWYVWVNDATHGEFARSFFWHHHFERATGNSVALASHPWWYYAPRFAIDFLPWTPLLVIGLVSFMRQKGMQPSRLEPGESTTRDAHVSPKSFTQVDDEAALGLVWMTTMIGLLSLAQFKRADYLLPAYPGAALLIGCVCEKWHRDSSVRVRKLATRTGLILVSICLAGWWWFHQYEEPRMEATRTHQAFATHIRNVAPIPQPILMFRTEAHLLAFHLGRPIHTVVEWGELNDRLAKPGTHWFVTRAEFADECLALVRTRRVVVVARSADFAPAKPLRPLVLMRTD